MAINSSKAVSGSSGNNDIEKDAVHTDPGFMSDTKPDLTEPQLNVGGHANVQRQLKSVHITMIGFCSGIGTGLFVGTGAAYAKAGPAGLLIAYCIVGFVLYCVMQSIAELATLIPTAGSFPHWATRFVDPSVGFSLAISYGYCYTIAIASEVSAAAVIVSYWTDITPAVVITVGLVLILVINLLSVKFYGHSEIFSGIIKVSSATQRERKKSRANAHSLLGFLLSWIGACRYCHHCRWWSQR